MGSSMVMVPSQGANPHVDKDSMGSSGRYRISKVFAEGASSLLPGGLMK